MGALAISFFAFIACEDSGIVGSSFVPTNPTLVVDTVEIGPITVESLVTYSGGKTFVAAGRFEDPLFGTYEAIGLMSPSLISIVDTTTVGIQYGFVLRPTATYGDSISTAVFDVYEIKERWRSNEWKADSQPVLADNPITRFEITEGDSVFVPLPQEWANRYRSFYDININSRDSAYVNQMFGFAFVPVSGNKISYINTTFSYFLAVRPDTTNISGTIRQRASSYRITEPPSVSPGNSIQLMNDFSKTGKMQFTIDNSVTQSEIISRVELVLYEDIERLNGTIAFGQTRFNNNIIRLFELDENEKQFYVTKDASLNAIRRASDGTYRINITGLANLALSDGGRTFTYYLTSDQDNGIIRPNLLVNSNSGARSPKLIITKISEN
jgi:hypothetical protein